jgi:hypothetical protein
MICWVRGFIQQQKQKSMKWSRREELGLGRSLDSLAVAHKQA